MFQHEVDGAERRHRLYNEIMSINGLSSLECIRVSKIIVKDQHLCIYIFTTRDSTFEHEFIQDVLRSEKNT